MSHKVIFKILGFPTDESIGPTLLDRMDAIIVSIGHKDNGNCKYNTPYNHSLQGNKTALVPLAFMVDASGRSVKLRVGFWPLNSTVNS